MEPEQKPSALQRFYFQDTPEQILLSLSTKTQSHIVAQNNNSLWLKEKELFHSYGEGPAIFSNNGTYALCNLCNMDNEIALYDITKNENPTFFYPQKKVISPHFSLDDTLLLVVIPTPSKSFPRVCVKNINTQDDLCGVTFTESINSACFDEDGSHMIIASKDNIEVYHITSLYLVRSIPHSHANKSYFNKDGSYAAIINDLNNISIFDIKTGDLVRTFTADNYSQVCHIHFSQDGKHIFTISSKGQVNILDIATGELVDSFEFDSPTTLMNYDTSTVSFSNDDSYLCVASLSHIAIWDIKIKRMICSLAHGYLSKSVCFNASNDRILSFGSNAMIWQQYAKWTLDQFLLCTLLFNWLLVQKPNKTAATIIDFIATIKIDKDNNTTDELTDIWNSFPEKVQKSIWDRINNIIQRHGK